MRRGVEISRIGSAIGTLRAIGGEGADSRVGETVRGRVVNGSAGIVFSAANPRPEGQDDPDGVVVLLLAAGLGRRFGGDKLAALLPDGRAVGAATLDLVRSAWPRVVCVVRPETAMAKLANGAGVDCIECPEAVDGMGVSLAAGVRATAQAAGWVVALADMPFLQPATVRQVALAVAAGGRLVAPTWRGTRGHPVGFHRSLIDELTGLTGDQGARQVLVRHASELQVVEVDDPGILRDIDRPTDLAGSAAG